MAAQFSFAVCLSVCSPTHAIQTHHAHTSDVKTSRPQNQKSETTNQKVRIHARLAFAHQPTGRRRQRQRQRQQQAQ
ncbi:hypothetical protein IWX47DRAFT_884424 [Phyllosticta citricarpa]